MADATTVLARLDKLEPPNAKGWINLTFKSAAGPLKVQTKYPEKLEGLRVGDAYEVTYTTTQRQGNDGRSFTNHYLSKIAPAPEKSMPPAPMEASEQPIPPDVWEAKDRRIAMEAAYHAASRFYNGRDITSAALYHVARAIYRDIIAAGQGDTFEAGLREDEELPF